MIYGIVMESDYPFTNLSPVSATPPDISFSCVQEPPAAGDWQRAGPVLSRPGTDESGGKRITFHRMDGFDVVHVAGSADYYIWPEKIIAHILDPRYGERLEIDFLGWILSLWLELHHVLAVHASAVVTRHGAVGFISGNHGGKSALAAAFVRDGYPLLTDDILPVETGEGPVFSARPGYPQMRMWPDEAEYFMGSCTGLLRVLPEYTKRRIPVGPPAFGRFCSRKQPLKVLYLPERRDEDGPIRIDALLQKDALIELVRNSFSARTLSALGLEGARMQSLANVAAHVPVRRLIYPSGFHRLAEVRKFLEKDIASL